MAPVPGSQGDHGPIGGRVVGRLGSGDAAKIDRVERVPAIHQALFGESRDVLRLLCISLIVAGIVGLKLVSAK